MPIPKNGKNALRLLAVQARKGKHYETFRRLGWHDGCIYLDLGRADHKVVKVTDDGKWEIVTDPPIRVVRSKSQAEMPLPLPMDEFNAYLAEHKHPT